MAKYLLIETRDPFEASDVGFCHDLARRLAAEGNQVILYLVQNGVLPARPGARAPASAACSRMTVLSHAPSDMPERRAASRAVSRASCRMPSPHRTPNFIPHPIRGGAARDEIDSRGPGAR